MPKKLTTVLLIVLVPILLAICLGEMMGPVMPEPVPDPMAGRTVLEVVNEHRRNAGKGLVVERPEQVEAASIAARDIAEDAHHVQEHELIASCFKNPADAMQAWSATDAYRRTLLADWQYFGFGTSKSDMTNCTYYVAVFGK